MRIDGSMPMHIARAYNLPLAAKPIPASGANVIGKIAPAAPKPVSNIDKLVAARIDQPIDFDRTALPLTPSPSGAHQLYTRATDRIEAAVVIELGRQIDVKG